MAARWGWCACLVVAAVSLAGCDRIPLLAPSQSTISLSAPLRILPLNGSTELTAVVIEQGGTPVHNGTAVRFTTTLGRVEPAEVQTRNGVATTTYYAGESSGIAEVRAISGAAGGGTDTASPSNVISITIGAAAVETVTVRANPASVSAAGGTVDIIAGALGANGRSLPGVPVTFNADNGTLSASSALTDANGEATVRLTTNVTTIVTAAAGGKTPATVTVSVRSAPAVTLTCRTGDGTAGNSCTAVTGTSIIFAAARAEGSAPLTGATLEFGDGTATALGTLSSGSTVAHTYDTPRNYTATLRATDVNGTTTTATVAVNITGGQLAVELSCAGATTAIGVCSQIAGQPVSFTAQRAATNTATLSGASLAFGDGRSATLGTLSGPASTLHTYGAAGTYVATLTATSATGATTTANVVVTVTAPTPLTVTLAAAVGTATTTGQPVSFTATATAPASSPVESFTWDFGDGVTTTTAGNTTTHVYGPGSTPPPNAVTSTTYTATVTVRTTDGRTATTRTEFQVRLAP